MGFVFIFRSRAHRARADRLSRALEARQLEVCAGLNEEPAEVRPSVSRALIDHCAVTVALWTRADLSDPSLVEPMRYAATRGKLLAVSLDGAQPPADLGPSVDLPRSWESNAAGIASLCDAIADLVSRALPADESGIDASARAAQEYAAYRRMHRRGGVESMARFLRSFPGGMFEDIVRAELDAATQPSYQPARRTLWPVGGSEARGVDLEAWRLGESRLTTAIKRRSFAGGAALAVGAAALAAVLLWSTSGGEQARRADASPNLARADVARTGEQRPDITRQTAVLSELRSRLEPVAPSVQPGPDPQASGEDGVSVAPLIPDSPVSAAQTSLAIADPLPEAPRDGAAFDIAGLEPAARAALQAARRNEARALRRARAAAEALTVRSRRGDGAYYGEWADDAANGFGRAVWANGDSYAGSWRSSLPEGHGVLNLASGLRYEGEFSGGLPTGQGVFWEADGRRLTGDRLFAALLSARAR